MSGMTAFSQDVEPLADKESRKKFFEGFYKADPFSIHGNVGLNLRSYQAAGTENRQAPFMWYLGGQMNVSIYKINIPLSVLLTAQSLTYSHPFHQGAYTNRFTRIGASPYYRWIKLHFGHRYMDFSPLTVANHTFLGAGIELTPGKFRSAFFYGLLAKTEPQDLALQNVNLQIFKRKGWGMKLGYGTRERFLDLIVFKARDKPNAVDPLNQDTAYIFQNENMVIGLNGQTMLFKKLRLNLEVASSAFTKDVADPETDSKRFLHPSFMIRPRTSTVFRSAVNAGIQYQYKILTLGLAYRRVDPEYRSLGAYFFNNDLENITGIAGVSLFKSRVRLNGSLGRQRNNLYGDKSTQFNRTIGSIDAQYSSGPFTMGLDFSNYTANIDYVLNQDLDSLNAVIVTRQLGLNTSYVITAENKNRHTISGNFSVQDITDDVEDLNRSAESQMLNGLLSYLFATGENGWKLNTRLSYNRNRLSGLTIDRYGIGAGAQKDLIPKKWSLGFDANYYNSTGESLENQTLNLRGNTLFKPGKHHRLDLSALLLNRFRASGVNARNFRETTLMLTYTYSF